MDVLLDEVDSLEAILMDDVKITKNSETGFPELIETVIFPTVGEDIDQQYVCITLQVMPTMGYPDIQPNYRLRNPRGLDDNGIEKIRLSVEEKLKESLGSPVVFDLIDIIREHLTDSNLPSGQCVVCLYGFQEGDEFTKTECYHYLHSYCLARHLEASKKNYQEELDKLPAWQRKTSQPYQALCPVCRELITDNIEPIRGASPPLELKNAPEFQLTNELKDLQAKMASLFMRQKSRGGIIDLKSEESNVISIDSEDSHEAHNRKKNANATNKCNGSSTSVTKSETDNSISSSASSASSTASNNQLNYLRQDKKSTTNNCNSNKSSQPTENKSSSTNKPVSQNDDDVDNDDNENDGNEKSQYHRGNKNRHRRNHNRHEHGNRKARQYAKHNPAAAAAANEQLHQACTSNNKR